MVKITDHQLHDLRVVASIFRIIRVGLDGFELDDAGLPLLSRVSKESEAMLTVVLTNLERVCLQRHPEVFRVCADDQLVGLEAVWSADDGTVGVLFACEVPWVRSSICTGR